MYSLIIDDSSGRQKVTCEIFVIINCTYNSPVYSSYINKTQPDSLRKIFYKCGCPKFIFNVINMAEILSL